MRQLSGKVIDVFGTVELVVIGCLSLFGLACLLYVLYFRYKIERDKLDALRDFNELWLVRIVLITFAILWALTEILRLPLLKRDGWPFSGLSHTLQGNMCRLYTLLSFGLFEPCFFLTALLLIRGSLRKLPFTRRRHWNRRVLLLVFAYALPVFLAHFFIVFITPGFTTSEGYNGRLPKYFTRAFEPAGVRGRNAICTYPFLSTVVLAAFSVVYLLYFFVVCWRMVDVVLNASLRRRIKGILAAVVVMLPAHVLFVAFTVFSLPGEALFEIFSFLAFVAVLVCTTVGEGILVIRPITDALAVRWSIEYNDRRDKAGREQPKEAPNSQPGEQEHTSRNNNKGKGINAIPDCRVVPVDSSATPVEDDVETNVGTSGREWSEDIQVSADSSGKNGSIETAEEDIAIDIVPMLIAEMMLESSLPPLVSKRSEGVPCDQHTAV
eukprot:jgi/Mesen1/1237/ME000129S00330